MAKTIYLSDKDLELLVDIFYNDVKYTETDELVEEKDKLINKILNRKPPP